MIWLKMADDPIEKTDKAVTKWLDRRHPAIRIPLKAIGFSFMTAGVLAATNAVVKRTPTTIDDEFVDTLYGRS